MTIESQEQAEDLFEKNREILALADELNTLFNNDNIENWTIAGLAVAGYKGEIFRIHHDADFLIWQKDLNKAKELLQSNGYEIIDGALNKKTNEYLYFTHKIIARKNGKEADIIYVEEDKEHAMVFATAFPEFKFPKKYLQGKRITLSNKAGRSFSFNVPDEKLLIAMMINSQRPTDREAMIFLSNKVTNDDLEEIRNKYALDYEKFTRNVWTGKITEGK